HRQRPLAGIAAARRAPARDYPARWREAPTVVSPIQSSGQCALSPPDAYPDPVTNHSNEIPAMNRGPGIQAATVFAALRLGGRRLLPLPLAPPDAAHRQALSSGLFA